MKEGVKHINVQEQERNRRERQRKGGAGEEKKGGSEREREREREFGRKGRKRGREREAHIKLNAVPGLCCPWQPQHHQLSMETASDSAEKEDSACLLLVLLPLRQPADFAVGSQGRSNGFTRITAQGWHQ